MTERKTRAFLYSGTRGVTSLSVSSSLPMLRDCLLPVQPAGVLVGIGYIRYLALMPFPARDCVTIPSAPRCDTRDTAYQLPMGYVHENLIHGSPSGFQRCSRYHAGFYAEIKAALSLPYPSSKFMTPHTPKPAPSPTTNVFKVSILVVKNCIKYVIRKPYNIHIVHNKFLYVPESSFFV